MISNKEYEHIYNIIKNTTNHKYVDDLFQEICLILLETPTSKIKTIKKSGRLFHYVFGIIRNQIRSKRGSFYKRFVEYDMNRTDINNIID